MSNPAQSTNAASNAADKRAFPRRRARGSAAVRPADKPMAPGFPATLTNISQAGVQLSAAKELAVGERVVVELQPAVGSARAVPMAAVVRWVAPEAQGGRFRIGCAWVCRLSYHEIQPFC